MPKQTFPFSTVTLMVTGISLVVGTLTLPGGDLSAVFRPQARGPSLEALRADRLVWREQRRLYSAAMEKCRDRRQDGQVVDCTTININDPATFQLFLTDAVSSTSSVPSVVHTAAPALTEEMLSARERSQLRRYSRVRTCPVTLKNYLPGFYELCERVVEETQPPSRGRIDSAAKKRVPSEPVLQRLTADDIAKAKKRPVPKRVPLQRHTESRFSSSASVVSSEESSLASSASSQE